MWLSFVLLCAVSAAGQQYGPVVFPAGFYEGPALRFRHYAGYLQPEPRSHFYFWLTEHENPDAHPLTMFLNGGPGLWQENGPFEVVPGTNGTKITERATRWNRYSNMLYLESPAGVGFSYQDDVGPNGTYATDDLRTARLNLNFLLQFFKAFPKYAGREFYITGESYAGTYIPTLAWAIAQYNANQPSSPINFKGFAVGNPCSAELIDHNAFFEAVKGRNLIPQTLAQQIEQECPPTYRYIAGNTCCQFNFSAYPQQSAACVSALNDMYNAFGNATVSVNLYDIYGPCVGGPQGYSPCLGDGHLPTLLDNPVFRRAIHAAPLSLIGGWVDCTTRLNYTSNYYDLPVQVYTPLLQKMPSLRVLIYSGDADACVPTAGTEKWTRSIGGPVVTPWQFWALDDQVAGYYVKYQKLSFLTVKGAGHLVPNTAPNRALRMFQMYLNDDFPTQQASHTARKRREKGFRA